MKLSEDWLAAALDWIASLPLLGDLELAAFTGLDELDARRLRMELSRRGWVEWVTPRGDGQRARPLALVREEALPPLAEWLGVTRAELPSRLPVGRSAALERIARIEVAQSVNRLLAMLASQLRESGEGTLETARSLPLALPPDQRWWPPHVEAHLRVRLDGEAGDGFVAWDRAGAPDLHRRARVRQWCAAAEDALDRGQPPPPILVACAGEREQHVWEEAVIERRGRAGRMLTEVLLAPAADVLRVGPLHVPWQAPGGGDGCEFLHWLDWRKSSPPSVTPEARVLPTVERRTPELREQLVGGGLPIDARAPLREQVASLALALDPQCRALLEWVARHPWLTARQLDVLVNDPEQAVVRRLDVLVRYGTVRGVRVPEMHNDVWIATGRGIGLFAAADQVPASRYQMAGAVAAPDDAQDRPGEVVLPRAFAHELGVNRAFVRLAERARRESGRLALWRNEAESTHIFGDPEHRWIRPDGSGVLELGDTPLPFLLEYDRGTLSRSQLRSKLVAYAHYYSGLVWEAYFDTEPVTLWVCADYRAARRIPAAAQSLGIELPTCIILEQHLGSTQTHGHGLQQSLLPEGYSRDHPPGERGGQG